jgi:nondiscriminating aspartyl-tRNA synthetase
MERILIADLKNHIGKKTRIRGRVDTIRDQGKIVFLMVRDRTGIIQVVTLDTENNSLTKKVKSLTLESVVDITGNVKEAVQVEPGYEIELLDIEIDSLSHTPLPIVIEGEHHDNMSALDIRLDYRWIDLRSTRNNLMISVATIVTNKLREFCINKDFKEIQAPRIISAASESGATVFEVKYFDKKAYLAQSPQFHKQMAIAADLERVFNVGPVFRAEKSFTTRHLTEYTSFDVEIAYIDSYKELCVFEQEMIKDMLVNVKEEYGDKIKEIFNIDITIPEKDFQYLTLKEAKEKLAKEGIHSKSDGDFSPEEERKISEIVKGETGCEFLFVTEYPHANRAFYHMKDPKNPHLALGYDLFWNGVEITSGAQREHRLENLKENAKERGIEPESLKEYLEYFKYGCPPHGGFAIGTERLLMKLLDFKSVLETTYLPNTPNRLGKLITTPMPGPTL